MLKRKLFSVSSHDLRSIKFLEQRNELEKDMLWSDLTFLQNNMLSNNNCSRCSHKTRFWRSRGETDEEQFQADTSFSVPVAFQITLPISARMRILFSCCGGTLIKVENFESYENSMVQELTIEPRKATYKLRNASVTLCRIKTPLQMVEKESWLENISIELQETTF